MSDGQTEFHESQAEWRRPPAPTDADRLIPGAKALVDEARREIAELALIRAAAVTELSHYQRMRAEIEGGWLYRLLTWGRKK